MRNPLARRSVAKTASRSVASTTARGKPATVHLHLFSPPSSPPPPRRRLQRQHDESGSRERHRQHHAQRSIQNKGNGKPPPSTSTSSLHLPYPPSPEERRHRADHCRGMVRIGEAESESNTIANCEFHDLHIHALIDYNLYQAPNNLFHHPSVPCTWERHPAKTSRTYVCTSY